MRERGKRELTGAGSTPETVLRERLAQGVSALVEEMQQGKSERLLEYLRFSSKFRRYSPHNRLLIFMDKPQATWVAGYKTWQKMGFQVRKGERAIRILAPRPYRYTVDEPQVPTLPSPERTDDGEQPQLVKRVIEGTHFISVPVFDASQVLGEKPLPEFWTSLPDDQQELTARLEAAVRSDGITLSESDHLGEAQGLSLQGEIMLKRGLDSRRRFLTLTHEYGHELLHRDQQRQDTPRPVMECHAEAVSYIVGHHVGIPNPFSSDYLLNWGNTPETLLAELTTVTTAAGYIIDKLDPPREQDAMQGEATVFTRVNALTPAIEQPSEPIPPAPQAANPSPFPTGEETQLPLFEREGSEGRTRPADRRLISSLLLDYARARVREITEKDESRCPHCGVPRAGNQDAHGACRFCADGEETPF